MCENNDFQKQCAESCQDLLKNYDKQVVFKKIEGKEESYLYSSVSGLNQKLEVYIYNDEAGFMVDGDKWTICEKPDYNSVKALIEDFLNKLDICVQKLC